MGRKEKKATTKKKAGGWVTDHPAQLLCMFVVFPKKTSFRSFPESQRRRKRAHKAEAVGALSLQPY